MVTDYKWQILNKLNAQSSLIQVSFFSFLKKKRNISIGSVCFPGFKTKLIQHLPLIQGGDMAVAAAGPACNTHINGCHFRKVLESSSKNSRICFITASNLHVTNFTQNKQEVHNLHDLHTHMINETSFTAYFTH